MRTFKYSVSLLLTTAAITSCSSSDSNSGPASTDPSILSCANSSKSNLSPSNCPNYTETKLPGTFFSESRKVLPFYDGFLVLRSISEPELLNLKVYSKIEDSIRGERGILAFIKDGKIVWEFKDKNFNIFDFDANSKKQIVAIAQNESEPGNVAKLLFFDTYGNPTVKAFTDNTQNSDPCINNISPYADSACLTPEENKYSPLVTFQISSPYIYKQAKVLWSKTSDQFYVVIDRGQQEITSLYKMQNLYTGALVTLWKRPLILGTLTAFNPLLLQSGEERIGLNRFGRFFDKQLLIDTEDDVYVGLSALLSKKAVLLAHMSEDENKSFIEKHGGLSSHVYKFKKNGKFQWRFSKPSSDFSTMITDAGIIGKSILTLSHRFVEKNLYRIVIDKLSLDSGTLVDSSGPLSIFPENSYGTSLIALNENELLFSGISGFRQNTPPAGMSMYDNGKAFVSKYMFSTKQLLASALRKSNRKDVVTGITLTNEKIYVLIDNDGPTTHSADQDTMQAYQKSSLIEFDNLNSLF